MAIIRAIKTVPPDRKDVKPTVAKVKIAENSKDIEFTDLDGKMLHIKVGLPTWESSLVEAEIAKVEEKITELLEDNGVNCLVFVTHYGVDISVVEPAFSVKKSSQSKNRKVTVEG